LCSPKPTCRRKPSADKKTESLCTISSSLLGKCSFLCTSTKCYATSPEALSGAKDQEEESPEAS